MTSRGGTNGANASRRRRSAPALVRRAAPELRDAGDAAKRATSRCCSARCRRPRRPPSGRCRSTDPMPAERVVPFMDLYVKLQRDGGRATSGGCCDMLRRAARRWRRTPWWCSPPTTASTAPRTACAARARGAYEEAIRVPLIVQATRAGALTAARSRPRMQLTSSVDVAPMLLTSRAGSNAWRRNPRYAHLARRLGPRGDPRGPRRAGAPVRAARDRRDRHRVRDRTLRRERAAARGGAAHGERRSTPRTPTGARAGSRRSAGGAGSASSTTTAPARAAWSCTTAQATAPGGIAAQRRCERALQLRAARLRCPRRLRAAHAPRLRQLLPDGHATRRGPPRRASCAGREGERGPPSPLAGDGLAPRSAGAPTGRRGPHRAGSIAEVPMAAPEASSACTAT